MAKLTFSGIGITEASGKLGNDVLFKNRYGACSRSYAIPVQPNTARQIATRDAMTAISNLWASLDEWQWDEWNAYALTQFSSNSIAHRFNQTGRGLFVQRNMNIVTAGQSPILIPDAKHVSPALLSVAIVTLTTSSVELNFGLMPSGLNVPANCVVVLSASPSVNTTIFSPKEFWNVIANLVEGDPLSGWDFYSAYSDSFGNPVSGKKIFFKGHTVNLLNGYKSPSFIISGLVY